MSLQKRVLCWLKCHTRTKPLVNERLFPHDQTLSRATQSARPSTPGSQLRIKVLCTPQARDKAAET